MSNPRSGQPYLTMLQRLVADTRSAIANGNDERLHTIIEVAEKAIGLLALVIAEAADVLADERRRAVARGLLAAAHRLTDPPARPGETPGAHAIDVRLITLSQREWRQLEEIAAKEGYGVDQTLGELLGFYLDYRDELRA